MGRYGKAWERRDASLILECFTKNGLYQESLLSNPYKGHSGIKKFWNSSVVNNTKNIKFSLKKCYVSHDGNTGFAEWICSNSYKSNGKWVKCKMSGIMVLKMKGNKITHLNEYWRTKNI